MWFHSRTGSDSNPTSLLDAALSGGMASGIGRRCWGRAELWPREVPSSLDVCPPAPPSPTPALGGRAEKCAGGWDGGSREERRPESLFSTPLESLCVVSALVHILKLST